MVTDFLANIPSPPQGVWQLGPLPLRAYALCIIAGIIVALYITQARYVRVGGDSNVVWDAAILAIPAGVIGGRAYHVITDHHKYFCADCDPVDALRITNGGLGIWGAVALGTVAVAAMFKIRGIRLAPFADAAAPAIVLAQGIGRLGTSAWMKTAIMPRLLEHPRVRSSPRYTRPSFMSCCGTLRSLSFCCGRTSASVWAAGKSSRCMWSAIPQVGSGLS